MSKLFSNGLNCFDHLILINILKNDQCSNRIDFRQSPSKKKKKRLILDKDISFGQLLFGVWFIYIYIW
jgi:hypothetical protein